MTTKTDNLFLKPKPKAAKQEVFHCGWVRKTSHELYSVILLQNSMYCYSSFSVISGTAWGNKKKETNKQTGN